MLNWKFVSSHPAHFIACGFGVGLLPRAPGTAGTLLAFPFFWLLKDVSSTGFYLLIVAALFALGVWVGEKTNQALGVADHSGIVWDEVVAFLLVLFFTPVTWGWYLLAFLLFRLFDIWKPFPIRYFDRRLKNGWGVMFDDLLAGVYTVIVIKLLERIFFA